MDAQPYSGTISGNGTPEDKAGKQRYIRFPAEVDKRTTLYFFNSGLYLFNTGLCVYQIATWRPCFSVTVIPRRAMDEASRIPDEVLVTVTVQFYTFRHLPSRLVNSDAHAGTTNPTKD